MDLSKLDNAMARMLMETINNMLIELYAAMAQAEIEKKEKRQREGIDSKKSRGDRDDYGRPAVMPLEEFRKEYQEVIDGNIKPFELMKKLGMSKTTYYRYVSKVKQFKKKWLSRENQTKQLKVLLVIIQISEYNVLQGVLILIKAVKTVNDRIMWNSIL